MNVFRITFDNGDIVTTGFNGSIADARQYYLGKVFNLGVWQDDLHRCTAVEQLRPMENALSVLDTMDEFRRTHQRQAPDWCMSVLTAIVKESGDCVASSTLEEMAVFRQTHQDPLRDPADWCMRVMEAIVANAAGYVGRNSWTDALRADQNSLYAQALQFPSAYRF